MTNSGADYAPFYCEETSTGRRRGFPGLKTSGWFSSLMPIDGLRLPLSVPVHRASARWAG